MFKINKSVYSESIVFVDSNGIEWFVPEDHANSDYQKYLEWLEEGNEPEVIDNTAPAE